MLDFQSFFENFQVFFNFFKLFAYLLLGQIVYFYEATS